MVAERNREATEPWELSISIGLAESPGGAEVDLWDLVGLADAEMIAAKRVKKSGHDGASAR